MEKYTRMKKDDEIKMLELFYEGKNNVEIGSIIHKHDTTIGYWLKKHGLKSGGIKNKCTDSQIKEICRVYSEDTTSTTPGIGEQFGVSERTVVKYLRDNNVTVRDGGITSKITNTDYFKNIDDQNKAYLLGFLIADGGIIVDKRKGRSNGLSMTLKSSDKYILNVLSRELGGNGSDNVYDSSTRDDFTFRVYNQELVDSLIPYGIVPRKTDISYLPLVRDDLMRHMVRGIFDGDGTVYTKDGGRRPYLRFGFYGTPLITTQIKDYLTKEINISDCKIIHKKGVSQVTFGKPVDAQNFYKLIYDGAENYLTRKKDKFDYFFTFL